MSQLVTLQPVFGCKSRGLSCLVGLLSLTACGSGSAPGGSSSPSDVVATFTALYGGTEAEQLAKAQAARSVAVGPYFEALLASTRNDPTKIAGLNVEGLHDKLAAVMPFYNFLGQHFPTFGELWDGLQIAPIAILPEASFTQLAANAVRTLAPSNAGLGLQDDPNYGPPEPGPINIYDPPIGSDTNEATEPYYRPNFSASGSSLTISAAPDANGDLQPLTGNIPLQMLPNPSTATRYLRDLQAAFAASNAPVVKTNAFRTRVMTLGRQQIQETVVNTVTGPRVDYSFKKVDGDSINMPMFSLGTAGGVIQDTSQSPGTSSYAKIVWRGAQ